MALTAATAAIQNPTAAITVFRRFNKPALGPVGDCLDDLEPPFGRWATAWTTSSRRSAGMPHDRVG
ncbi:MAG TPA: hypothetical protein VF237_03080, partial [Xanthobacteraceae bacterium]